jgi:hypothetical protein
MTSICAVSRSCRSRTRTSLPAGEYDAALSIRFSITVSIISSLPSTKIPGDNSPRNLMSRPVAAETRIVELLERENELIRGQLTVKDKQIADMQERAHDGWYGDGGYGWQDNGWRERAWRWHEWRRQWWREHHPYWGYYNYAPPTVYYSAPSWYSQPAPYGYTGYGN